MDSKLNAGLGKKALFIAAHAPDPNAKQAGHKQAHEHLLELRESHVVDTVILCNTRPDELNAANRCTDSKYIVPYSRMAKSFGVVCGLFAGIPPRFATRVSLRALRLIDRLIAEHRYSLIWLEFSQTHWLYPRIAARCGPGVTFVLSSHDLQTQVVARKSAFERGTFAACTQRYESKLLRAAHRIRIPSQKDAEFIRTEFGAQLPVDVKTPTLSTFVKEVRRSPNAVEPYSLLFWGAMNRAENHQAVSRFVEVSFPRLCEVFPSAHLFIVGANPPPAITRLASERITVTGFVESPVRYFEAASLGIVPLVSGAGIKLKTLEMLAAGLTVVATPIGAEGIECSPRLVVCEIDELAETIIRIWRATSGR